MKRRKSRKSLALIMILSLILMNFTSLFSIALVTTTNYVNVHLSGFSGVTAVSIYYTPTGEWLDLTEQVADKFWRREDNKEFVSTDIPIIRIVHSEGTTDLDPASDYVGVEGGGTVNYWVGDSQQIIINKVVTNHMEGNTDSFSFKVYSKEKNGDAYVEIPAEAFVLPHGGTHIIYVDSNIYYKVEEIIPAGYETNPSDGIYESGKINAKKSYSFTYYNTKHYNEISGTKFNDMNGNGIQDGEEPGIEGVIIFVDVDVNGQYDGTEPQATTDGNGEYTIAGIPGGTWNVYEIVPDGWSNTTPNPISIKVPSLAPITGIDFGNILDVYSISGWKYDDEKNPIEGVTIYLELDGEPGLTSGDRSDVTESDGSYLFGGLLPGPYEVHEVVPDEWIQQLPGDPWYHDVTIVDTDLTDVNFVNARATYDIGGYVFIDTPIYDYSNVETGIENITVELVGVGTTTTDEYGHYLFEDLLAGTYRVEADTLDEITLGHVSEKDGTLDEWVDVTVGPTVNDVNFGYYTPPAEKGNVLITKYIDVLETAVHEGVQFTLTRTSTQATYSGYTDSNGQLYFENIPVGSYNLSETTPDGFTVVYIDDEHVVNISDGETEEVFILNNLTPNEGTAYNYVGGTISGTKYDFDTEEGLEGWTINLYEGTSTDGDPYMTTTTDENGEYMFTELDPGIYTVEEVMQEDWYAIGGETTFEAEIEGDVEYQFTQHMDSDTTLKNMLWMDENVAFVAEGRIGDLGGMAEKELNLHTEPGYVIEDEAHYAWPNNAVPTHFELTYDAGSNLVTYVVDGETLSFTLDSDVPFNDIMVRTRATKENTGIMVYNLYLDGNLIHDNSVAIGNEDDHDILWIGNRELVGGFTLTGDVVMYWTEALVPMRSHLAFQIMVGDAYSLGKDSDTVDFWNSEIETWTVSGYVFNDIDGDNVKETGEVGYVGQTVSLGSHATTTTTTDGYYEFTGIPGTSGDDWIIVDDTGLPPQVSEYGDDGILDSQTEVTFSEVVDIPVNFGYYQPEQNYYNIYGYKFNDEDGDGIWEDGEEGLEGFTIYIDGNGNNAYDSGEPMDVTDEDGYYALYEIPEGNVVVREVQQSGWTQTYPSGGEHAFYLDNYFEGYVNFGNTESTPPPPPPPPRPKYDVSGYVFEDNNSDNLLNGDDFGYAGVTVELYSSADTLLKTTTTNSNGRYSFTNLRGNYTIIVDPLGELPGNFNVTDQVSEYDDTLDQVVEISVYDDINLVNFGYLATPLALPTLISGNVFNDLNEDNAVDSGEIGYSNVEVTLWNGATPVLTKPTDSTGQYVFNFALEPELQGLEPGLYVVSIGDTPVNIYQVSEYDGSPFNQMVILTVEEDTIIIPDVNFGFMDTVVPSGETANIPMILAGLFLITAGIGIRKKPFLTSK